MVRKLTIVAGIVAGLLLASGCSAHSAIVDAGAVTPTVTTSPTPTLIPTPTPLATPTLPAPSTSPDKAWVAGFRAQFPVPAGTTDDGILATGKAICIKLADPSNTAITLDKSNPKTQAAIKLARATLCPE